VNRYYIFIFLICFFVNYHYFSESSFTFPKVKSLSLIKKDPHASINLIKPKEKNNISFNNFQAEALHNLQKSEYNFIIQCDEISYTTPNREQNLRFHYNDNGFSVQPRTTKIPQGIYDKNTPETDKKYLEIANWNIAFNVDKTQIGDGNWKIENNKADYITKNVTVQYINNEQGMRQNFIVQNHLPNNDSSSNTLSLNFSVKTELDCKLNGNSLQFYNGTENVINYQDLKVWDANQQILEAHFEKINDTTNEYAIVVNTENATYPITIDPISTTPSATLTTNQQIAWLGYSVASAGDVNGDGYSDVIVGAPLYDNGQSDEGVAFVYHGSAAGIGNTAAAILECNQDFAEFGTSVASAGDVNGDGYSDVIVGAWFYDSGESNEGAAFIYHGSPSGISNTAVAMVESNQEDAYLGNAVSSAGDVNSDGYSDLIIGAYKYDNGQTDEGAAFVYKGGATGINSTAADTLESNQYFAYMGYSVASAGDVNGDGYSDIIIGAYSYDNGLTDEGAAFIYHGSAIGINTSAAAFVESNQIDAEMGRSVASAGDVNGDGYSDIIVGAYLYTNGQSYEGRVFIYHGSTTGINTSAATSIESNQANAHMGWSVASAGDINGDGYSDVIIGAHNYDNGHTNEGKIFVYQGSAMGIITTEVASVEGNQANAQLGASVASAGDVNGDGFSDVIVGAFRFGNFTEGRAYVFHGSASGVSNISNATRESNQADAQMGISVANAGDVNGDGYNDVIVGVVGYNNGQYKEGAAFMYYGSINGIGSTATILESNVELALLGESVSSAGDINGDGFSDIIVGAYKYSNGQANEGAAYIYYGSALGINPTPTIIESNKADTEFGISVSAAGDVNGDGYSDVIVGAFKYDNGESDEGAFYVYHGGVSGINTTAATVHESNQSDANFGTKVSKAGDVNGDGFCDVIVSAPPFDNGQFDEGAAFVYYGSASGISLATSAFLEKNQAYAFMGNSIASAGDVNGDGYGDVIVGAYKYDNGQTDEGVAFIYHGGPTGITTSSFTLEMNQANAQFGNAVSGAGDLNGDGYSDLSVGAILFDNNETDEGQVFVYHGSALGNLNFAKTLEVNQAHAGMGSSVAGGGDVNGDGFSDIIAGARYYDNGQTDEGAAFLYFGNEAIPANNSTLSFYNENLITKINRINFTQALFGTGLFARSFLGRDKGKLIWETRQNFNPYSGAPISNSTAFSGQQNSYTDLGVAGIELKNLIAKMPGGNYTKVRMRIKYNPATAITGQVYGPWRYATINSFGSTFNPTAKHWNGNLNEVWTNNMNWNSYAVPTINDHVIIPSTANNMPRVTDTAAVNSLTLSQGSNLIVADNKMLKIAGFITTNPVSSITANTAISGGEILTGSGLAFTARGMCFGTKPYPDISGTKTVDGSGTGSFTSTLTGLTSNTIYYVRAYATNSQGTAYGQERSFLSGFTCGQVLNYEGEQYNTVLISTQCWMAENLNVGEMISGSGTSPMTDNNIIEKYCYANDPANCNTYGGLYQWNEAMKYSTAQSAQGICPVGWHLPSDAEWTILENALPSTDKGSRISANELLWFNGPLDGSAQFATISFGALPSGYRSSNNPFFEIGFRSFFWSSTEYSSNGSHAWLRYLESFNTNIWKDFFNKSSGFSVRCVKN
jgi:uncharacterized protein (TIGR02145 family)